MIFMSILKTKHDELIVIDTRYGGNSMEFSKVENGWVYYNARKEILAEITYGIVQNSNSVIVNRTFVDPSLRGQGVAEKLLAVLVEDMRQQGKKIIPQCSYVKNKFSQNPEKYSDVWVK